jgi:hypothetical protein
MNTDTEGMNAVGRRDVFAYFEGQGPNQICNIRMMLTASYVGLLKRALRPRISAPLASRRG